MASRTAARQRERRAHRSSRLRGQIPSGRGGTPTRQKRSRMMYAWLHGQPSTAPSPPRISTCSCPERVSSGGTSVPCGQGWLRRVGKAGSSRDWAPTWPVPRGSATVACGVLRAHLWRRCIKTTVGKSATTVVEMGAAASLVEVLARCVALA
jgi:hypothetical protein